MQPKIKNATFAAACNPYQKLRFNSKERLQTKRFAVFLITQVTKT